MTEEIYGPESVYDDEVAGVLLEAGKICEANGLALVATVWYGDGDFARTVSMPENCPLPPKLVDLAAKANGNFDAMAIALARSLPPEVSGQSIVLRMMLHKTEDPDAPERQIERMLETKIGLRKSRAELRKQVKELKVYNKGLEDDRQVCLDRLRELGDTALGHGLGGS